MTNCVIAWKKTDNKLDFNMQLSETCNLNYTHDLIEKLIF